MRLKAAGRVLAAALVLATAACGDEERDQPAPTAATPNPTVEAEAATPAPSGSVANAFIGSIAIDPADGTMLLGTGLGLVRVERGGGRAKRVVGELRTADGEGTLSSNLVVRFSKPGELLASGHPEGGTLPENLGLVRSTDHGRTWEPMAQLGEADFHLLELADGRVVAVRAEEEKVLVSADGGRSFDARTPPAPPLDLAVNPEDPDRMAVATAQGVFTSADEGRSWRQRDTVPADQLAWAAPDALYRADPGGAIKASSDGGQTWTERGSVDLSVNEIAVADGDLYASVPGGEVRRSADGGRTWQRYVRLE